MLPSFIRERAPPQRSTIAIFFLWHVNGTLITINRPHCRLVAIRASQFFGVKREKNWIRREFKSPDFRR
jgi:hypothetical protein